MEICVSSEDSSIFVVDGYNHRVQIMLLPELQAAKKLFSGVSGQKEIESTENFRYIRPSQISVQTDISLLKLPRYARILDVREQDTCHVQQDSDAVKLLFPVIGAHIYVPRGDINHLLQQDFFEESDQDDIMMTSHTAADSDVTATDTRKLDADGAALMKVIPKNVQQLNHQANVFMGLITGVVMNSWEVDDMHDSNSNSSGNYNIERSSSDPLGTCASHPNENRCADQQHSVIDYGLIVPSVFALNALLERSWLPSASLPSSVISSFVHLMCNDDVAATATPVNSAERRRAVAAASALLLAVTCAGTDASDSVFAHIIDELQRLAARVPLSETTSRSLIAETIREIEAAENIQISVSSYGADKNVSVGASFDSRSKSIADRDTERDRDGEKEGDNALNALRLLAFILSTKNCSTYLYPSALSASTLRTFSDDVNGQKVHNMNVRAIPFLPCPTSTCASSSSSSSSSSNSGGCAVEIRTLLFGQGWADNFRSIASQVKGETVVIKEVVETKRQMLSGAMTPTPTSNPHSQSVSPVPPHSFPSFTLHPSSYAPRGVEHSSHVRTSEPSFALKKELLNLLNSVSKVNRARLSYGDFRSKPSSSSSSSNNGVSAAALRLELLTNAKLSFDQVKIHKFGDLSLNLYTHCRFTRTLIDQIAHSKYQDIIRIQIISQLMTPMYFYATTKPCVNIKSEV